MNPPDPQASRSQYNVLDPAPHTLYECQSAEEFLARFEATTGLRVETITQGLIKDGTPTAIFLVGSIPLGMGTRGSDVDIVVLVDSKEALANDQERIVNDSQQASFLNEADPLIAGTFIQLHEGILVEVQVAITSAIRNVYARLRRRSPELGETETRILGRLKAGWLLWESEGYLKHTSIDWSDRTLAVYCCTRNFVTALTHQRKAAKALELRDLTLALHLGRASAEMAYLAYFASEGLMYLGVKWLAQLGFAREAGARLARHPALKENLHLLFPVFHSTLDEATQYQQDVGEFLNSMRNLIEKQIIFRIAFKACIQIALA